MLSIGGVVGRVVLVNAPGAWLAHLRERYDAFWIPPAPAVECAFVLTVQFVSAAPVKPGGRTVEAEKKPLTVAAAENSLRIARWDFRARLAPGKRAAQPWTGAARCEMNPFSFDSLLRVLWSVFLPRAGGALVHACGLRRGDLAAVFPGKSEAGKTTLARKMAEPDHVLSDEVCAIARGEDGAWRVWGSPFWGEFARGGTSIRSFPLRTFGFLEQGPSLQVTDVGAADAALRLLECFICFQNDRATVAQNLYIATRIVREVATVRLQSARSTSADAIFAAVDPHLGATDRRHPPQSAREAISEFRAFLTKHETYAFRPKGGSMRPWMKSGDSLFIQAAGETQVAPGDVLLYWTPGPTPAEDRLTCHRMVARVSTARGSRFYTKGDSLSGIDRFDNGRQAQLLGKVSGISRNGKTWRVPGRIGSLARLFGSLAATPFLKVLGR